MRARAWLVIVVALSLVGIAACSPRSSATIELDKPVALADAPVHVRVSGLGSGDELTVSAKARDAGGKVWRSQAQFTADDSGVVDRDRAQPKSGTYQGVDGMGLFWFPFQPDGTTVIHPVTGGLIALGGTRPANAAARRDGWPKVLEFLDQL